MRDNCINRECDNLVKTNGYKVDGTRKYYKWCSQCHKKKYNDTWRKHYVHKKRPPKVGKYEGYVRLPSCECCSFLALHMCQLDTDHIDGDHDNNDPTNLQTLCSNCHRLKTWLNRDWDKRQA